MTDLLSRLSAATGPSRELDAEIALANGWTRGGRGLWFDAVGEIYGGPPRYTESIDAAMTLVQAGLIIIFMIYGSNTVVQLRPEGAISSGKTEGASKATPAIALVIACLKARMEKDNAGQ